MSDVRLVIAIPSAGMVPMPFAYSLATLLSYTSAHGVRTVPEANIDITMQIVESSNWIENREQLAEHAIETDRTHLMFLDDDMSFEPQVLEILLGRRQQIVTTNYLIKTEDWRTDPQYVAVDLNDKRITVTKDKTGIQPISYSGFGVSVIDVDVFRKMPRPLFIPDYNPETKKYTTEDNPFFRRAREAGFTVYVDHDASKLLTHIGRSAWNWKGVSHG
jgi:hypothetical protein